eukprot:COSAG01_NODE_23717_length_804_cov_1.004255_1_plen_99_part_10
MMPTSWLFILAQFSYNVVYLWSCETLSAASRRKHSSKKGTYATAHSALPAQFQPKPNLLWNDMCNDEASRQREARRVGAWGARAARRRTRPRNGILADK